MEMIAHERALIGFDSLRFLKLLHHVRKFMASNSTKKSKVDTSKTNARPRVSAEQKKLRRQQAIMSIFGLMLVIAMVVSLFAR